jgi:uncharacterized protein (DUF849 family)
MGFHVRVGREVLLWIGPGHLAESNAQQVTQIPTILEAFDLYVAAPDEAGQIFQVNGRDDIGF